MQILKSRQLAMIAFGVAYGIVIRLLVQPPAFLHLRETSFLNSHVVVGGFWVMTAGFLAFVPVTMGWITIEDATSDGEFHWARWIFLPWATVILADLALFATYVEGMICVVFAIPITLISSSIGGILAGLSHRKQFLGSRATTLCLAVIPLFISAIETQLQAPLDLRTVHNSIVIHAPAQIVWDSIKTVPMIQKNELRPTWTHRIGFPLPVEATLDREAVGGVRHASFEHGLLFIETVTRWEPNHDLAFTIAADTEHIPPTTLDEHVTIGGPYFDVLNGEYRLEPLHDGTILLHLTSQQRLNTDFNGYAHLWTDAVMSDLQQSILEVVKHRCESGTTRSTDILNP